MNSAAKKQDIRIGRISKKKLKLTENLLLWTSNKTKNNNLLTGNTKFMITSQNYSYKNPQNKPILELLIEKPPITHPVAVQVVHVSGRKICFSKLMKVTTSVAVICLVFLGYAYAFSELDKAYE